MVGSILIESCGGKHAGGESVAEEEDDGEGALHHPVDVEKAPQRGEGQQADECN